MKNYVLCLKHGTKYTSDYVNRLYNMVSRNITVNYEFVCLTEDSKDLNPNIKVIPLKLSEQIEGWWYKPMVFNPELELKGTILFLDLDVVIFENIDKLFTYEPNKFCIIKDYYAKRKGKEGMNSSCFRFCHNTNTHVYYDFLKNSNKIMKSMHGDQDWIQMAIQSNYAYWPDNWIKSFKWEMHNEKDFTKNGDRYIIRNNPKVEPENCIAVFHGYPKPDQIDQNWCKKNWK